MIGHAVAGYVSGATARGDCGAGALSAEFGEFASPYLPGAPESTLRVVSVAVAGGVSAELGGGKFADGAVTAGFGYLFNELSHGVSKEQAGYEQRMSRLGFADAVDQWAAGDGMDIRVPMDSLDFSGVSASQTFGNLIGRSVPVTLSGEDYLVYGTVSLTLVGPNTVAATMGYDRYNFDMKSWRDFAIRNLGTAGGLTVNQSWSYATRFKSGRPYYIQLDGMARIRP